MTQATQRAHLLPEASDDGVILTRIAEGDLGALGLLYDRYAIRLLRFARRIVGAQDAADVVHTTFLRVVTLAAAYDSTAVSARPWLFGILVRIAQEHRRSVRRWASAMLRLSAQPARTAPTIPEMRTDLDACLSKLSLAKRSVLILAEVEGFTCEEIADMLAIPIGTVWTRLHHARRGLRQSYEGDES
jgi:RNA polymerase sigma-70 factor (ECF subfamily)